MKTICQFSCGAASAVATKLILSEGLADVWILNAFLKEEHEDNRRFLSDCERWFGQPITVLRDEKYGASAREVFRRRRYLKGARGAPCSAVLKRELLASVVTLDDTIVLGFTAEEQDRMDLFIDANNVKVRAPLIERGLTKDDCLAMIERAGIELPLMYLLGFNNANCIGCVKGGEGYWNRIRTHFPRDFEEMAAIQEAIGPGANLFRNRVTGERFSLRELDPKAGRHNEPMPSCSFFCEQAEGEFDHG